MVRPEFIGERGEEVARLVNPTGVKRKKSFAQLKRCKNPRKAAKMMRNSMTAQEPILKESGEAVALPDLHAYKDELDEPRPLLREKRIQTTKFAASLRSQQAKSPRQVEEKDPQMDAQKGNPTITHKGAVEPILERQDEEERSKAPQNPRRNKLASPVHELLDPREALDSIMGAKRLSIQGVPIAAILASQKPEEVWQFPKRKKNRKMDAHFAIRDLSKPSIIKDRMTKVNEIDDSIWNSKNSARSVTSVKHKNERNELRSFQENPAAGRNNSKCSLIVNKILDSEKMTSRNKKSSSSVSCGQPGHYSRTCRFANHDDANQT
jgi:hypothetical protein